MILLKNCTYFFIHLNAGAKIRKENNFMKFYAIILHNYLKIMRTWLRRSLKFPV